MSGKHAGQSARFLIALAGAVETGAADGGTARPVATAPAKPAAAARPKPAGKPSGLAAGPAKPSGPAAAPAKPSGPAAAPAKRPPSDDFEP